MTARPFFLDERVQVVFQTEGESRNFFGYYGMSPIDRSGNRLLAHQISFDGRGVLDTDTAAVGYWDLSSGSFTKVGSTRAFNLQQGAMLQWMPPDHEKRIVYNDIEGGRFVARVHDLATGDTRTLPHDIYAPHPSGTFALGSNNERLYFCRPGYNYSGVVNDKWNRPIHEEDGIFRIDMGSVSVDLIVSTRQIADIAPQRSRETLDNYLEIFVWNPSGTRFAFLHRWNDKQGGHTTRLFTAGADGSGIFMFPDSGFYSHMGWRNDEEFTIWGQLNPWGSRISSSVREHAPLRSLLKPPYDLLKSVISRGSLGRRMIPKTGYLKCRDLTGTTGILGEGLLTENGHNTWTRDGRWMLTDTYEDDQGYRSLLLYDSREGRLHRIGRFLSPFNRSVYRCDLHPRFDHSEKLVIIDSSHGGSGRQMSVLDIRVIMEENP